MFRAVGIVIILITLSKMFSEAFVAFEDALVANLTFVETAANVASVELLNKQEE